MQKLLSKAIADLEIMMDTYGVEPVLRALADIAGEPGDMLAEQVRPGKANIVKQLAKALLDAMGSVAGAPVKLAAKTGAGAIGKAFDQDVRISAQGPVLKVTDTGLYALISQTNALIKQTHELLSGAQEAIHGSTKELEDIEFSIDDWIASKETLSGGEDVSASDVQTRQSAGLPPSRSKPEEDKYKDKKSVTRL